MFYISEKFGVCDGIIFFGMLDDNTSGAMDVYCDQPGQCIHSGRQQTSRGQGAAPSSNI